MRWPLMVVLVLAFAALALAVSPAPALAETLVDSGFESGTDGAALTSSIWTAIGAPQHGEYDNTQSKNGAMSGWVQGPTTATNGGVYETASGGLTGNDAEVRFWLYFDNTTQSRLIEDYSAGLSTADRAFQINFASGGNINVFTDRAGNPNGYATSVLTPVGTYSTGWTEFRIVYTFSGTNAQTYTLSKRASTSDPWTPMKAAAATGFAIPFRGTNNVTQTHGTLWRGYQNAQMWIDDLRFSNTPISDVPNLGALVDAGFENGTDGAALSTSRTWSLSGTPQRAEYDSAQAKNGALSGWIQGPSALTYAGVAETSTANMTSNGAEERFWVYLDTTNQFRIFEDYPIGLPTADRAYYVQFANNGNIYIYTDRTGNPNGYTSAGYTQVGTYATGWTEMRVVHNFSGTSAQTYQLSMRSSATAPWTQLKGASSTGYDIPFRGTNTITRTHGMLFRAYQNANMWIDDVRYSDSGILDPDVSPPTAPTGLLASDHLGDEGGAIDLTWNASIDNVGVTNYRLYRGTSPGVYGAPITLFSLTNYTDNTVVSGTRYYYAVSAVDAAGNASALSPESSAIAVDDLPPAVPTGLAAVGGTGQVALTWTANGEPDLAGYDLYRNGTKVNTTPLTGTSFTDTGRAAGTMYSYRLASVDTHGNASAQCPQSLRRRREPRAESSTADSRTAATGPRSARRGTSEGLRSTLSTTVLGRRTARSRAGSRARRRPRTRASAKPPPPT